MSGNNLSYSWTRALPPLWWSVQYGVGVVRRGGLGLTLCTMNACGKYMLLINACNPLKKDI